jgi:hypothetical protein
MGWIFKPISILRALLLFPLAVFRPPEDEAWTQSLSVGTPQALQEFISQYPHSSKVESAFDLMVNFQVETARAGAWRNALEAQVAQDPEMLELEFDFDSY